MFSRAWTLIANAASNHPTAVPAVLVIRSSTSKIRWPSTSCVVSIASDSVNPIATACFRRHSNTPSGTNNATFSSIPWNATGPSRNVSATHWNGR